MQNYKLLFYLFLFTLTWILIAILLTVALLSTDILEEEKTVDNSCPSVIELPLIGLHTFSYCEEKNMVWDGRNNRWVNPGRLERKRIDAYKGQ